MNKLISNQYDVDKSPYNTIQEVAESIVESCPSGEPALLQNYQNFSIFFA